MIQEAWKWMFFFFPSFLLFCSSSGAVWAGRVEEIVEPWLSALWGFKKMQAIRNSCLTCSQVGRLNWLVCKHWEMVGTGVRGAMTVIRLWFYFRLLFEWWISPCRGSFMVLKRYNLKPEWRIQLYYKQLPGSLFCTTNLGLSMNKPVIFFSPTKHYKQNLLVLTEWKLALAHLENSIRLQYKIPLGKNVEGHFQQQQVDASFPGSIWCNRRITIDQFNS